MNNRLLCVLVATALFSLHTAQTLAKAPGAKPILQARVDARVELMSIIFRLAGNPEYTKGRVDSYTRDVDEHFLRFTNHAVVQLARELRKNRGVSYDAPMSLAVHLTDAFALKEKVPFKPHPEGLDGRWRLREVRTFLQEARRFVEESRFKEFFQEHQRLYEPAAARMTQTMSQYGHLEWFDSFFGERPGTNFHLFLGMLNGPNCYGVRLLAGDKQEMYCILGVWACDGKGVPQFPKTVLPTVVHEFCHSYVNPFVIKYAGDFEKAGKKIYIRVEKKMKRQAYGNWQTMVHESIVRACVVRYRRANEGIFAAISEILQQGKLGFVWTDKLANLLEEYEKQRETYATFEAFMPKVIQFFNDYAAELQES